MIEQARSRRPPAAVQADTGPWLVAALCVLAVGVGVGIVLGRFLPDAAPAAPAVAATEFEPFAPQRAERPARPSPPPEQPAVVAAAPATAAPEVAAPAPLPTWRRNAVVVNADPDAPWIAIVIDDVGLNRTNSARAAALSGPLTLAYLPYAEDLATQTARARAAGHELLVHVPMEPESTTEDPGKNALRTTLDSDEIARRLDWALGRFQGYVGVSNHMGSRFTADGAAMTAALELLGARGLLFLDSRTTSRTRGKGVARALGVPFLERDVFLDNELSRVAIGRQLDLAESVARRQGHAVAIGHPHTVTLDVLERRLPQLERRGFVLVPVATIVAARLALEQGLDGPLVHLDP